MKPITDRKYKAKYSNFCALSFYYSWTIWISQGGYIVLDTVSQLDRNQTGGYMWLIYKHYNTLYEVLNVRGFGCLRESWIQPPADPPRTDCTIRTQNKLHFCVEIKCEENPPATELEEEMPSVVTETGTAFPTPASTPQPPAVCHEPFPSSLVKLRVTKETSHCRQSWVLKSLKPVSTSLLWNTASKTVSDVILSHRHSWCQVSG